MSTPRILTDAERAAFADTLHAHRQQLIDDIVTHLVGEIETLMRRPGYVFPHGVIYSKFLTVDLPGGPGPATVVVDFRVELPGADAAVDAYLEMLDSLAWEDSSEEGAAS